MISTLANVTTLISVFFLTVTIMFVVITILAGIPNIAIIYDCHFVNAHSLDIPAVVSGCHVGTLFLDIAGCFIGYSHYINIYPCYYVCIYSSDIISRFIDICGCRLINCCHYLDICFFLDWFTGGSCYVSICFPVSLFVGNCRYVGICSTSIALICGCHFVDIRFFSIAAIAVGRYLRHALLASSTVIAVLIHAFLILLPLLLAVILVQTVTFFLTVFLCIVFVWCFCIDLLLLTKMS